LDGGGVYTGGCEAFASAADNVADSLPVIGEYRAASDFVDHPSVLGAAVLAASVVDAGAVAKKVATLAKNVVQGAKAEAKVVAKLGDKIAGQRVTLESSTTGKRSVADIVSKDKEVTEVKSGDAHQ
jgi:hypothetical protein